jgi:hypothetical protein
MLVKIVCVFFGDGSEKILRGSPEKIRTALDYIKPMLGEGAIVAEKQAHVCSQRAENMLWKDFVHEARQAGHGSFAYETYGLWIRESHASWESLLDLRALYHFRPGSPPYRDTSYDGSEGWKKPLYPG